jgi:hypothetical protein
MTVRNLAAGEQRALLEQMPNGATDGIATVCTVREGAGGAVTFGTSCAGELSNVGELSNPAPTPAWDSTETRHIAEGEAELLPIGGAVDADTQAAFNASRWSASGAFVLDRALTCDSSRVRFVSWRGAHFIGDAAIATTQTCDLRVLALAH